MKGLIFGMTPYGLPYIAMNQMGRVLIDRLFALNYYYAFLLAAVGINLLSKKLQPTSRGISLMRKIPSAKCVVFILVLIISISVFPYVTQEYFSATYSLPYGGQHLLADIIMSHYQGGTVVSSLVIVNYQLINRGIPHANVLGSLYIPSDDIMEAYRWLGKHNVSWFIGDDNMLRSFSFLSVTGSIEEHPIFRQSRESIVVYSVNQSELQRLIQGQSP